MKSSEIKDVATQQFIGNVSSAMILLSIMKIEMKWIEMRHPAVRENLYTLGYIYIYIYRFYILVLLGLAQRYVGLGLGLGLALKLQQKF